MNLNQLHYFVMLAHMEHYTKAAKKLEISQPSLSHAIASLEQELGTALFEKQGRNVVLTKYGRVFREYVEESLDILEVGIKKTRALTSEISGEIDMAYIPPLGSERIPEMVKKFVGENEGKQIIFRFHSELSQHVIEGVQDEKYDLGFCCHLKKEKELQFVPVAYEELVAIVPFGHGLAGRDCIAFKDIARYPQICFSETNEMRPVIDDCFKKEEITPQIRYTADEVNSLAGLVAKGFGVAIIPNISAIKGLAVRVIPITDLEYRNYIYLVTKKNIYQSPVVKRFLQFIRKHFAIEIS